MKFYLFSSKTLTILFSMNDKIELFEKTSIKKSVITLATPTIIGSLVMIIYNLADTYFVGLLKSPKETAAVTLISVLLLMFNAVNNLFGVGTSSMMSRALGRKDYDTLSKSSATGFYGALAFAILFSIFATIFKTPILYLIGADETTFDVAYRYMFYTVNLGAVPAIMNVVMSYMIKSEGETLHASIGAMSGCILNIILDPFFVLPRFLGMGAAGAGLATLISNCFALGYFFVLILIVRKGKTQVCLDIKKISFESFIFGGICAVGIPAAIQNLLNVLGQGILNNYAAGYGPEAISAIGISYRLYTIPFMVAMGASQGVMPLISYNFASGNIKRMKEATFFTLKVTGLALLGFTCFYLVFASNFVAFFLNNEQVVAIGSIILRGMALALPFIGIDFTGVGVFQATGYGKLSLIFAILRKIILEIPFIILFNKLWPLYGLGFSQFAAEFILAIASVIVLNNLFKKWEVRNSN